MPITVVLPDDTIYRKEPEMNSASDDEWERTAISEEARKALAAAAPGQDLFRPADLEMITVNKQPMNVPPLPAPRTISIVGAEPEKAIADVLRYRAAVEDEQRLRAEMDGLLGRPARKRKGG